MYKNNRLEFNKQLYGNIQYSQKQPRNFSFQISFVINMTTLAATQHVPWV